MQHLPVVDPNVAVQHNAQHLDPSHGSVECAPGMSQPQRARTAQALRKPLSRQGTPMRGTPLSSISQSFAAPLKPMTLIDFQRTIATASASSLTDETITRMMTHLAPEAYAAVQPLFASKRTMSHFLHEVAALKITSAFRSFEMTLQQFQKVVFDDLADRPTAEADIVETMKQLGPQTKDRIMGAYDTRSSLSSFLAELRLMKPLPSDVEGLVFDTTVYLPKIHDHLMDSEARIPRKPIFDEGSIQVEVTHRMRGILVDWLVEVSQRFNFHQETMFITIVLVDRYLMEHRLTRNELQLVGTAALMLASKYEEIYPPQVNEFVFITANAYTAAEIIRMERQIFITMGFHVTFPSMITFADCIMATQDPQPTDVQKHLVRYILHTMLIAYPTGKHLGSLVAATAVYIARRWCRVETPPPPYEIKNLVPSMLLEVAAINSGSRLNAIRNMFAQPKYSAVSSLNIPSEAAVLQ